MADTDKEAAKNAETKDAKAADIKSNPSAAQTANVAGSAADEQEAREKRAEAEREDHERYLDNTAKETPAKEVKSVSAALAKSELGIGDHGVQTFANTPENPPPPMHPLREVRDEERVKLEITDSDHPDPLDPKVTYAHPDAVGDFLRAGWRRPAA